MNTEIQCARPFALMAAIVSGSMLAPFAGPQQDAKAAPQDPPVASAPAQQNAAPPAAPSSPPQADDDAPDVEPGVVDDAFDDFWGDSGDAAVDAPGRAIDAFRSFPGFRPFSLQFDPRAFAQGGGGSLSMDSTTIDNGVEKRIHVQVEPSGKARATITSTDAKGDRTERTIEADSLDALRSQAPELESMLAGPSIGGGQDPFQGLDRMFQAWPFGGNARAPQQRGLNRLPRRPTAPPNVMPAQPEGPRLGVQARLIPADDPLRAQLQLAPNVGLLVDAVVPGSLADKLGMQRFDVVTKIEALPIGDAADVLLALKEADDGLIEVHVVRGGKALLLTYETSKDSSDA